MSDRLYFDVEQAWKEGWTLSDRSCDPPFAIETLDDPEAHDVKWSFDNDQDAYVHVVTQAYAGSVYHQGALDFLRLHSPEGLAWAIDTYNDRMGKPRIRVPLRRTT